MKKIVLIIFLFPCFIYGQEVMASDSTAVTTIDGTIDEMLRIVNGEKGKSRNWKAFKKLFLPSARFTVVNFEGGAYESASVDEMIEFMNDDYYDQGYSERSINRIIDSFNGIAQVVEVVEHKEPDGNKAMGLNSYHLVYANQRWWISNIIWTFETSGSKIPDKYFKN